MGSAVKVCPACMISTACNFRAKVDEFVPKTQNGNLRIVFIMGSIVKVCPAFMMPTACPFRPKVDGFVPKTHDGNLRKFCNDVDHGLCCEGMPRLHNLHRLPSALKC